MTTITFRTNEFKFSDTEIDKFISEDLSVSEWRSRIISSGFKTEKKVDSFLKKEFKLLEEGFCLGYAFCRASQLLNHQKIEPVTSKQDLIGIIRAQMAHVIGVDVKIEYKTSKLNLIKKIFNLIAKDNPFVLNKLKNLRKLVRASDLKSTVKILSCFAMHYAKSSYIQNKCLNRLNNCFKKNVKLESLSKHLKYQYQEGLMKSDKKIKLKSTEGKYLQGQELIKKVESLSDKYPTFSLMITQKYSAGPSHQIAIHKKKDEYFFIDSNCGVGLLEEGFKAFEKLIKTKKELADGSKIKKFSVVTYFPQNTNSIDFKKKITK